MSEFHKNAPFTMRRADGRGKDDDDNDGDDAGGSSSSADVWKRQFGCRHSRCYGSVYH